MSPAPKAILVAVCLSQILSAIRMATTPARSATVRFQKRGES